MILVPDLFIPRHPELAGTCKQAVEKLVREDPSLTAVTGWYHDALWGAREHWWATREDGTIVDPTVEQFPTGHHPELRSYEVYDGTLPCRGCDLRIPKEQHSINTGFCCGGCFADTVGVPCDPCTCSKETS